MQDYTDMTLYNSGNKTAIRKLALIRPHSTTDPKSFSFLSEYRVFVCPLPEPVAHYPIRPSCAFAGQASQPKTIKVRQIK